MGLATDWALETEGVAVGVVEVELFDHQRPLKPDLARSAAHGDTGPYFAG